MAKKNTNLHNAKKAKNDEFYTQLSDIEKEMAHYKEFFKGKIVYCNCDDARESNFFKFFANNFESLGLKKLISTGFKENGKGVKLVYEGDKNGNFMVDDEEIAVTELEGNGDFRSEECIEFLKECDVVVTNPPFSLFREYVAQLMEYGKKFLIIGNGNAVTYKEIFPYIKNNELWLGAGKGMGGKAMEFFVDASIYDSTKGSVNRVENGKCYVGVMMCTWFTNIPHDKRNTELDLFRKYNETDYPKYENYDAIEVSRVENIPMDYEGVMGVPISFLDKYCPTQFEIVGLGIANLGLDCGVQPYKAEHREYRKNIQKRGVVDGDLYMVINGEVKVPYARILIRRKKTEPIVEVETTDNVSVNEVEQNDVQQTNNVEVVETNITSKEIYTLTRRPYSDEDMYIDSVTIENGTIVANKHNTKRGVKIKSTNTDLNTTDVVAEENLPP